VRVEFDPDQISYEEIMRKFYAAAPKRQSRGGKVQYMSAVWAQDEAQRAVAERLAREVRSEVPTLAPTDWHDAEEYHQDYWEKFARLGRSPYPG